MKPYLMSNFPSVRPSLNLQFDSQPTPADMTSHLASVGATFSRASIGTYVDANGVIQEATAGQARPNYSTAGVHEGLLIEEARTNLVKSSEDLSVEWSGASAGAGSSPVVTINQAIAPDGTASADKIFFDAGGTTSSDRSQLVSNNISVTLGNTYTSFIYLKGDSGGEIIEIRHANGTTFTDFTLTTEWQKCVVTETVSTSTATRPLNLRCIGNNQQTATVYAWGAQLEAGSFPTSYIPTIPTFEERASPATFFDSSGVLQTQASQSGASAEGRIDHKYIDGEWVEAGLLLEGASTNLIEDSEDFTGGTVWITTGTVTRTADQISAPDGNTTADEITATAGGSTVCQVPFDETLSGNYVASVFAKAGTLDFMQINIPFHTSGNVANFDLVNGTVNNVQGSGGVIEDVGNGWFRCSQTFTDDASDGGIGITPVGSLTASRRVASSGSVYVWGAQLEEGSQPTSYIATSGGEATRSADVYTTETKERSADVCYIDGTAFTDFYNQEQGTVFFNGKNPDYEGSNSERFYFLTKEVNNKVELQKVTLNDKIRFIVRKDDVTGDKVMDVSGGSTFKHAVAFFNDSTESRHVLNGTQQTNVSVVDTFSENLNNFGIGQIPDTGRQINSTIKKLIYFPRALSDNELIKLTQ